MELNTSIFCVNVLLSKVKFAHDCFALDTHNIIERLINIRLVDKCESGVWERGTLCLSTYTICKCVHVEFV